MSTFAKKDNNKPIRLMSKVIRHTKKRGKTISIKLGNPLTESQGLDADVN
jgi:hypothetical protein